jgi:hypothetical protein
VIIVARYSQASYRIYIQTNRSTEDGPQKQERKKKLTFQPLASYTRNIVSAYNSRSIM